MEIANECPKGFIDIVKELHKIQLECIEVGLTCSVDLNHIDYPYVTIYVFDPKPRKNRRQLLSAMFDSLEFRDKDNQKEWNKITKYYKQMKAKAAQEKAKKNK